MNLNVVMYHYIRDLHSSEYPELKALELKKFITQLSYLQSKYNIVSSKEISNAIYNGGSLPEKPLLLTFDDGYKDHLEVSNILYKRGLSGLFFPVLSVLDNKKVLDVNKIHFILASVKSGKNLKLELDDILIKKYGFKIKDINRLSNQFAKPNRWDKGEIIYFKRLLQHELPDECRTTLVNYFFQKHLNVSEEDFSNKLYLDKTDLHKMHKIGMEFGSHGTNHIWLNKVDRDIQEYDILNSYKRMREIGIIKNEFYFCYPYGGYNVDTLNILKQNKCSLAFTVDPKPFNLHKEDPLKISRFDTNDFPTDN